jgi:hypothetical protein
VYLKVGFRFPAEVKLFPLFKSIEMGSAIQPSPIQYVRRLSLCAGKAAGEK